MCIVSYLPTRKGFCITSNRDEQIHRPTLKPDVYSYKGKKFIYPKDLKLGGTWFAIDPESKKASCLLNAKSTFKIKSPKISRGRLPIAWLEQGIDCFDNQLLQTAPFVLITLEFFSDTPKLVAFIWDSKNLREERLDNNQAYLWCSSSLYKPERNEAFQKSFKRELDSIHKNNNLLGFHQKVAQPLNSIVYSEKNKDIQTVSITSLTSDAENNHLDYFDLKLKSEEFNRLKL